MFSGHSSPLSVLFEVEIAQHHVHVVMRHTRSLGGLADPGAVSFVLDPDTLAQVFLVQLARAEDQEGPRKEGAWAVPMHVRHAYEGYLSHEMQLLSVLTHEQGLRLLEDPEEVLGEKHQHIVKSRTELATSRREVQRVFFRGHTLGSSPRARWRSVRCKI